MNDSTGRMIRSALQFVAGGGLTLLIAAVGDGLGPVAAPALLAFNTLAVIVAQNFLEGRGILKPILKPAGLGPVVSEVVDKTGQVVGGVVGMTTELAETVAGVVISDDTNEIVGAVGPKDDEGE